LSCGNGTGGGWRVRIKMTKNDCKPWQGVTAETISAICIGIHIRRRPDDTTHTVVSAITGF